jgi:hypothetical protein
MYLLKIIERRRGVSYVRSCLMEEPIRSCKWFKQWIDSNDIGLTKFLGANKLPRTDFFASVKVN